MTITQFTDSDAAQKATGPCGPCGCEKYADCDYCSYCTPENFPGSPEYADWERENEACLALRREEERNLLPLGVYMYGTEPYDDLPW